LAQAIGHRPQATGKPRLILGKRPLATEKSFR
jgi:hypothetical protein